MKPEIIIFGLAMLVIGFWAGHEYAMAKVLGNAVTLMNEVAANRPEVRVRAMAKRYSWQFHYPGPDGAWGETNASEGNS
jgi:heme/copper-type cytochrome/quinol oxidase subunit 2